jgi:hypothetical protein
MFSKIFTCAVGVWLSLAAVGHAAIFGIVSGVVEDPQHQAVPQADVRLRAQLSSWEAQGQTDREGKFSIAMVPAGDYTISVSKTGFQLVEQHIVVRSETVTALTVALPIGAISEMVEVVGTEGAVNPKSVTTESLVTRDQIDRAPGALRTNSLDVVTQFVPGSYLVHDQLHVRGGHQVSWLIDGVPVPNTNIASNVGPQFDPKDIETIEIQRGGMSAEFGDRTYGVFNVITRSGFERSREGEFLVNYGSFHETNSQLSLGDHTGRMAYYGSLSFNRTDLGLQTPVPESIHNRANGVGGFGSFIYSASPANQYRLVASVRNDRYQIPNSPDDQDTGIRDLQRERDAFVNVSWLHTVGTDASLSVSPFYHFNRAAFDGGPSDPIITTDYRTSQYAGAQAVLTISKGPHTGRIGGYGFSQTDDLLFGLDDGSGAPVSQTAGPTGQLAVAFVDEQYAASGWLTLNAGLRLTRFSGSLSENAVSPRVGVAVRLPRDWAVRAFYGRYYQPPPLTTVSGPLLDLAVQQGFDFLPLKGERDEQYEVGLAIPARGWTLDLDYFRTNAENFFDHEPIGNSNIFVPLTIDTARIRGWEATVRSPRRGRAQLHLAYSHQFIEGRGAVSGGLTDFSPPSDDFFFLDHDQRDTLTGGVDVAASPGTSVSLSTGYGSGFLEGDGPDHKPGHIVFNVQGSKALGTQWTVIVTALNVGDTHFLLDQSNTFGGTHYNSPRQISAGLRYRFHY